MATPARPPSVRRSVSARRPSVALGAVLAVAVAMAVAGPLAVEAVAQSAGMSPEAAGGGRRRSVRKDGGHRRPGGDGARGRLDLYDRRGHGDARGCRSGPARGLCRAARRCGTAADRGRPVRPVHPRLRRLALASGRRPRRLPGRPRRSAWPRRCGRAPTPSAARRTAVWRFCWWRGIWPMRRSITVSGWFATISTLKRAALPQMLSCWPSRRIFWREMAEATGDGEIAVAASRSAALIARAIGPVGLIHELGAAGNRNRLSRNGSDESIRPTASPT